MKKTLITLAALAASVASAATLDFNTATNGSTVDFTGNDTITLTGATTITTELVAYPTWTTTITCGDVTVTADPVRLFGVHYDEGSDNNTNREIAGATINFGTNGSLTVDQEGGINLINMALTFNVTLGDYYVETDDASLDGTKTGTTATRTLFTDAKSGMWNYEPKNYTVAVSDVEGNAISGFTVSGSATSIGLSYDTVYKYVAPETPDTPAVPEPTTATLSLLALAGLAARRRRK